jgi:hypothetical protein
MSQDFLSQEEVDRLLRPRSDWGVIAKPIVIRGCTFNRIDINSPDVRRFMEETYEEGEDYVFYHHDVMVTDEVLFMLALRFSSEKA